MWLYSYNHHVALESRHIDKLSDRGRQLQWGYLLCQLLPVTIVFYDYIGFILCEAKCVYIL